jgi:hypothetical protein
MNKVKINVVKEEKIDNRVNNTGRPINKKSARQLRLKKQAYYKSQYTKFMNGNTFTILNTSNTYTYECSDDRDYGYIVNAVGGHVCNVNYIGRTKVLGFTYVLNKRVNVEINLKEVNF